MSTKHGIDMVVYGLYTDDTNKKRFVSTLDTLNVAMGKIKSRLDEYNCTVEKKANHWKEPPAIQWYMGRQRSLDKIKDPDITYIFSGSYILGPRAAELLRPVVATWRNCCRSRSRGKRGTL